MLWWCGSGVEVGMQMLITNDGWMGGGSGVGKGVVVVGCSRCGHGGTVLYKQLEFHFRK